MTPTFDTIKTAVEKTGLTRRGGFHADPGEGASAAPIAPDGCRTLILIGDIGGDFWPRFRAERRDEPDPLDAWTRRVLGPVASDLGAKVFYPFDGPPHWPFQQWATRAEGLRCAPIGPLMHPAAGPWHSYRGALGFADKIDLPPVAQTAHACDGCSEKPCLSGCPVNAFSAASFALDACVGHLKSPEGAPCLTGGCLARRACPVGADRAYAPDHQEFLARAFLRAFGD
ncbi:MAG: ferredoxin [Rhodospirillaceae bacterium]